MEMMVNTPAAALRPQIQSGPYPSGSFNRQDLRRLTPIIDAGPTEQEPRNPRSNRLVRKIMMVSSALLVAGLCILAGVTLFGEGISRGGHSASVEKTEFVIANDVLRIPKNLVRFSSQRSGGMVSRLELYVQWPSMSGYQDALKSDFSSAGQQGNLIFLSLEPRSMSHDMSGRIAPIYSKFFDGPPGQPIAGLIRQPLSAEGGFIDEDLFYEANSPYPYTARCVRQSSTIATPFCLRDIHIGRDLMLTYRFHIRHLEEWHLIERQVRNRVQAMLVNPK